MNLIDINLLSEKKKRTPLFLYSAGILLLLFFITLLFLMISLHSIRNETERTQVSLSQTKQLVQLQQEKIIDSQSSNGIRDLQETVKRMETYPIETIPLLNELISLLPQRGFIQTFEYRDRQVINFTVQFDASREAAYYLERMKGMNWITEAEIQEITTEEIISEEAALEEAILPRYVVQYELTLNSIKLQELKEESSLSLEEEGEE
ncbi:hypothetical protein [Rossellomorea aquimaris]|uniref:hypothetical protein n=1 Tax=Rossellomorea aquimaris TaxID=189382 RepID=UPI0007D09E01|nr:hypothetical protein [Rossellomorea aquimaris]